MEGNAAGPAKTTERRDAEIYLCGNPNGVTTLSLEALSKEKREAIRRLHQLDDKKNVRILFFFAVWMVSGYLALTLDHPIVVAASSTMTAGAMIGCTVLLHEASHRLLFRNPTLNRWLGFLCGLPVFLSVSGYWTNHKMHHARRSSATDPDQDWSLDLNAAQSVSAYLLGNLAKAFAFITVLPIIAIVKADRKGRVRALTEYALILGFFLLLFKTLPLEAIWKLWLLPMLIASLLTQARAIAEHGLTTRGNGFTATRTVVSNRFVSFMMCNINYHLEHHLFPGLPWYNLPKVHQLMQEEYRRAGASIYRSYTEFFIEFFKALRAGFIPNARLISEESRRAMGC